MSRPALASIDRSSTSWLTNLNANFQKLIDAPFPIVAYADSATLTSSHDAKLYHDCFAIAGHALYYSDGTSWSLVKEQLTYIADLDTGTAVLSDIVTAYNNLLADMITKGWMAAT